MAVEVGVEEAVEVQVKKGISLKHVRKLIYYSKNDDAINKFTSDSIRYKNLTSFKKYIEKGNVFYYSLINEYDLLTGFALFKFKKIPERIYLRKIYPNEYGITFAIRIYGKYRGKGLALKFMKDVFEKFIITKEYKNKKDNKFWIKVSERNIPAVKTYEKFGFVKVSKPDKTGKIIMIYQNKV